MFNVTCRAFLRQQLMPSWSLNLQALEPVPWKKHCEIIPIYGTAPSLKNRTFLAKNRGGRPFLPRKRDFLIGSDQDTIYTYNGVGCTTLCQCSLSWTESEWRSSRWLGRGFQVLCFEEKRKPVLLKRSVMNYVMHCKAQRWRINLLPSPSSCIAPS